MDPSYYEALRLVLGEWRKRRVDYPSADEAFIQNVIDAALVRLIGAPIKGVAEAVGADFGEWVTLKNEAKRIYKFENGEVKEVERPVKMKHVQSGHELLCEDGNSTVIQTNHDDKDRRLLWYDIIKEKK